jgi:hypothetical protein
MFDLNFKNALLYLHLTKAYNIDVTIFRRTTT